MSRMNSKSNESVYRRKSSRNGEIQHPKRLILGKK